MANDQTLWQGIVKGERAAFDGLFRLYSAPLRVFLRRYTSNPKAALESWHFGESYSICVFEAGERNQRAARGRADLRVTKQKLPTAGRRSEPIAPIKPMPSRSIHPVAGSAIGVVTVIVPDSISPRAMPGDPFHPSISVSTENSPSLI